MTTISVGVAGLGYWGPNLARNFAAIPGCELAWLCDGDPAALERVGAAIPSARRTADLEDLLADDALDAVVLATPVPTHAALAEQVLRAGKHCFVEKPLAQTVADAERAVEAARETGRTLMVGHLLEYHPGVAKLKEIADARRARRHPLHLLQPAQPREAARGRERALVARRARRLRPAPPRRRGAATRSRRAASPTCARGSRTSCSPSCASRPGSPRTCTCRGWTPTRSAASRSSAPGAWRRSTTWTWSGRSPSTTRGSTRAPGRGASTSPARATSGAPRSATASRCGSSASTSSTACATGARRCRTGRPGCASCACWRRCRSSSTSTRREQRAAV